MDLTKACASDYVHECVCASVSVCMGVCVCVCVFVCVCEHVCMDIKNVCMCLYGIIFFMYVLVYGCCH